MKKICCFGEILLRMSPDTRNEWIDNAAMPVYVGGAELNVANALAAWQIPVRYISAMPENNMSRSIQQYLSGKGVDTSMMNFSGERTGIYYLTQGTDLKHADVIYDRAGSSFATLQTGVLNWDEILQDVDWFHFSAISPALAQQSADLTLEALKAAASRNITISVDLNYRSRLWKYGRTPVEIMPALTQYCHVIMGNIWSANTLLGIPVDDHIHDRKRRHAYLDHATFTAATIIKQFPKCRTVANTFRFDVDNEIHYYATINDAGGQYVSREFSTANPLDKVGSGDCFMAGLIYGYTKQLPKPEIVNYAAAAAFGKMMEPGDSTRRSPEEVTAILNDYGQ